ncbi:MULTISPECIES: CDP-alcohol phosphatidyltransferase family protein [unclassified Sinorhizobium]|uniref:CDP-alcohol phosphatidyltransferase family protein n=1 Tax=unclassified Sinorhizobium TaxID=2613772 RepID=UPI0024C3918F|nr:MULTISPECIES: CDP-alcohol phosphatidyltransferase family protein [unclassified Sinorhizobium]MDK1377776.1 CDP-alcohol phosphatidyltransferase family protein [Sinorhizobium sp. 6-70]MDK1481608.1 CDP-alcohol phosphatidyltransferase family protein [Sinorhizobium sp. 6-117]
MLDGAVRRRLDPLLDRLGVALVRRGVRADTITIFGLGLGLAAAGLIAYRFYLAGAVMILLSRLCDGLDGAVARASRRTDFGGFLDIVLDFAFYGAIPLAFIVADPARNGLAGAFLLFSFYVNGSSFLAYAIMAEKRAMTTSVRGAKSLYFTTGLAEATETIVVFVAFCLLPGWFPPIAAVFAVVCLYTAVSRIVLARLSLFEQQ